LSRPPAALADGGWSGPAVTEPSKRQLDKEEGALRLPLAVPARPSEYYSPSPVKMVMRFGKKDCLVSS
jgi:hypothetical protein